MIDGRGAIIFGIVNVIFFFINVTKIVGNGK